MKFNLKSSLFGLLLIAGSTQPVATMGQVKAALISIIPAPVGAGTASVVTDTRLKSNVGNVGPSYPYFLGYQINSIMQQQPATKTCTVRSSNVLSLNLFNLPYVRTIAADGEHNTARKLVTVVDKDDNSLICGIVFSVNGTECTAEYLDVATTTALLNKKAIDVERGFSVRQIPIGGLGYTALGLAGIAGLYWYHNYAIRTAVETAKKAIREELANQGTEKAKEVAATGVFAALGALGTAIGGLFKSAPATPQ